MAGCRSTTGSASRLLRSGSGISCRSGRHLKDDPPCPRSTASWIGTRMSQAYAPLDEVVMAVTEEGPTREELQLATRNHGLPLEALSYDVTPLGLHFLLTHFDIPMIDPRAWKLIIDGSVGNPVTLTLADLAAMPTMTIPVVLECAGNGRARLEPRPAGQPWLFEAVGQAEWTGVRLLGRPGHSRDPGGNNRSGIHGCRPRDRWRRGAAIPAEPAPGRGSPSRCDPGPSG